MQLALTMAGATGTELRYQNDDDQPNSPGTAYAHNPDGSRLSLTWPANVTNGVGGVNLGKTNYAYDGTGRHVQTKFPWLYGVWQHQYQLNGWTKRTDGPLSPGAVNPLVRTQYGYNARGFLTLLANYTDYSSGGSDLLQGASSFALTYDALGNKRTEAATVPSQGGSPLADASHALTYTYDDANASAAQNRDVLVGEVSGVYGSGTGGYNTLYSHAGSGGYGYDAAYNPTLFSYWNGGADATLSLPANSDNQISLGGFAYEGDGNPATYKGAAFGFDPEDRLTTISSPAFAATYDGDGLRATKTAAGVTTYFLYDGSTPIAEETFSGTSASFSALNGWTADGWRARKQGGIVYQYVYDPQGSVQQRHTDGAYSSGLAAYDRSTFEGYGALRGAYKGSTGAGVGQHDPAGFGGQFGYYTDTETGLLCLTHRYYDPGTGKFLNRDPIGYAGGANLYGFADGNPVNESDPSGLDPLEAKREILSDMSDISATAKTNGIQPELLAGVVYAEVNAGGATGWNALSRQMSIQKFAVGGNGKFWGKGDLGITKFHQFSKDHPELKTYGQRYAWAESRNANTHLSLVESAGMLGGLARRRYGSSASNLTNAQMAIVISEYNLGARPMRANAQPNKEGRAYLQGATWINMVFHSPHFRRKESAGLFHYSGPWSP